MTSSAGVKLACRETRPLEVRLGALVQKLIEPHRILGIHILGHDACNLVHIGLAFMQKGGVAQDLVDMVFNYPTLAEAYRIAAFNARITATASGPVSSSRKPCL